jgi:hypothetical protein
MYIFMFKFVSRRRRRGFAPAIHPHRTQRHEWANSYLQTSPFLILLLLCCTFSDSTRRNKDAYSTVFLLKPHISSHRVLPPRSQIYLRHTRATLPFQHLHSPATKL